MTQKSNFELIKSSKRLVVKVGSKLLVDETDGKDNWGWRRSCLDLLKRARKLVDEKNPKCEIAIDGGIRADNLAPLVSCDPDVIVLSSAIFKDTDGIHTALKKCRNAIEKAQN